jgi:hypothetical protein
MLWSLGRESGLSGAGKVPRGSLECRPFGGQAFLAAPETRGVLEAPLYEVSDATSDVEWPRTWRGPFRPARFFSFFETRMAAIHHGTEDGPAAMLHLGTDAGIDAMVGRGS